MSSISESLGRRRFIAVGVSFFAGCGSESQQTETSTATSAREPRTPPNGTYNATFIANSPCESVRVRVIDPIEKETIAEGEAPLEVELEGGKTYKVAAHAGYRERMMGVLKARGRKELTLYSDNWRCG